MAAIPGPEVEKRRDDLDEARRLLADRETRSVEGRGDPARVIIEIAEEIGADLIAVGTCGQGRFGRALRGSVSSDVVHRASGSVLVVR